MSSKVAITCSRRCTPTSGPIHNSLKFCHWNLNSILARDKTKITLTEAYNSIFHYDLFAESLLNESVENNDLFIEGFSKEIFRNDHPSGNKVGGVCLFFKQNIPIKRRQDLELIQETIVTEISLGWKKIFFVVVYRSPNQSSEEFNIFQESL